MQENQTLQEIINRINPALCALIMETTNVKDLVKIRQDHRKDKDVETVVNARIENLMYLAQWY